MTAKTPPPVPVEVRRVLPTDPMVVIGIDPGTGGKLAVSVLTWDEGRLQRARVTTVREPAPQCWYRLAEVLGEYTFDEDVTAVAVENQLNVITGAGHERGRVTQAGMVLLYPQAIAYAAGLPVLLLEPSTIKAAVANGRATKTQVATAVRGLLAAHQVAVKPANEHEFDAVAIAVAGRGRLLTKGVPV
jgi:Holliday junction resolvasome RuvABC endonuclease subunit